MDDYKNATQLIFNSYLKEPGIEKVSAKPNFAEYWK